MYLDDVVVAVKNGNGRERLRQVLQVLRDNRVKLNREKGCIRESEVIYLGHGIYSKVLHPTGENLEALKGARAPTNVSELHSFLGLITYYNHFVSNIAALLYRLYALLQKGLKWH